MPNDVSRRDLLKASAIAGFGASAIGASSAASAVGVRVFPLPTRLYKTADFSHEQTESWIFWLFVETTAPRQLKIDRISIITSSGTALVRKSTYEGGGAAALTITPRITPKLLDG